MKQFHDVAVATAARRVKIRPACATAALDRFTSLIVRDPDGNKLCVLHRPTMSEIVSEIRSHRGRQLVVHPRVVGDRDRHDLLDLPAAAGREGGKLPVVWYLSGLTCTQANVTEKGEYRAACAELGLIFVAPDTSPRGDGVRTRRGL